MKLSGASVAVTRPREQAAEMMAALEARGARVLAVPLIRIVPAREEAPLLRAAGAANAYDWVVFTSANGVEALFTRMPAAVSERLRTRIACVGPGTAQAVRTHGQSPALVSSGRTAEHLLAELCATGMRGKRVLLPQAAGARVVLADGLRAAGAALDVVEAYRTAGDTARAAELGALCRAGAVDLVTFTASSAVRTFVTSAGTAIGDARVAVIGPVTAQTARELDLRVDIEAPEHTIDGLLAAISAASE